MTHCDWVLVMCIYAYSTGRLVHLTHPALPLLFCNALYLARTCLATDDVNVASQLLFGTWPKRASAPIVLDSSIGLKLLSLVSVLYWKGEIERTALAFLQAPNELLELSSTFRRPSER